MKFTALKGGVVYSIQKSPKSDDWALVTPAPFLSRDITACLPTKQSKNAGGGDS